jgi:hypothetical protein
VPISIHEPNMLNFLASAHFHSRAQYAELPSWLEKNDRTECSFPFTSPRDGLLSSREVSPAPAPVFFDWICRHRPKVSWRPFSPAPPSFPELFISGESRVRWVLELTPPLLGARAGPAFGCLRRPLLGHVSPVAGL